MDVITTVAPATPVVPVVGKVKRVRAAKVVVAAKKSAPKPKVALLGDYNPTWVIVALKKAVACGIRPSSARYARVVFALKCKTVKQALAGPVGPSNLAFMVAKGIIAVRKPS